MKEIEVPDGATVLTLAELIDVPARRLVQTAFEELGRLVTTEDSLPFDEIRALLAHLGYDARRQRE
jgi:hypothetical protein